MNGNDGRTMLDFDEKLQKVDLGSGSDMSRGGGFSYFSTNSR